MLEYCDLFAQIGRQLLTVREELIKALPNLRAFARSRANSPSDADDLVSRTSLRILDKEEELKQKNVKILPYAITIIRNLIIDDHRAHERRKTDIGVDESDGASMSDVNQMNWSPQGSSYFSAEASATINETFRLFKQLSENCREILSLLARELTYAEISESLNIERSTVGTRALRCRKQLKALSNGGAT